MNNFLNIAQHVTVNACNIFWHYLPMTTPTAPSSKTPKSTRRIQVRQSGVHGKGVFALQDISKGETVIEYVGEIISAQEAEDRHPHDPNDPNHTFYFQIDEDRVIDALHGGNSARWINHSCSPNCKPVVEDGRVFIKAKKDIPQGTELNYDYGLILDEPITRKLMAQYPCWCGSSNCRQTLLAGKPRSKKKDDKAKAKELRKTIQKLKAKLARLEKK
jgi:SET domain-containing protein